MRTMNHPRRRRPRIIPTTFVAALIAVLAAGAAPARAQDRDADCHCVDRDGNRIEDCVCLNTPSGNTFTVMTPFARRSIVGVTIDYSQGAEVDARGAELQEVQDDGPADRAGLRAGDIVVRVDGRSVFDPLDGRAERALSESQSVPVQRFVRIVGGLDPDEPVEVEYIRDGRTARATVTPESAGGFPGLTIFGEGEGLPGMAWRFDPEERGPGVFRFESPGRNSEMRFFGDSLATGAFPRLFRDDPCMNVSTGDGSTRVWVLGGTNCVDGVEFVELNPGLGEYFGTDQGVLVANVAEASTLGLRAGDVLQAVDGREVQSPEHARRILASYDSDEEIRLRVVRKGAETEVLARRR